MEAAAHNPAFAEKAGIPQSVAKEFVAADKSCSEGLEWQAVSRSEESAINRRLGVAVRSTRHEIHSKAKWQRKLED
jgi:hypothetical protein